MNMCKTCKMTMNEQDDITIGVDDPNKTNEMTTEPETTHNNTQSTPEEENDPNRGYKYNI